MANENLKLWLAVEKTNPKYTKNANGVTVEFYDSQSALVHLGKYHALFVDRLKIETWRDEIVELLESGLIKPSQVIDELGEDLAVELFESAGIPITATD